MAEKGEEQRKQRGSSSRQEVGAGEIPSELEKSQHALEEEKKRAEDYLNRLKYLQADFENYKKQTKRDFDIFVRFANERIIVGLLDVLDSLDQAVANGEAQSRRDSFFDGLRLIAKRLWEVLRSEGVEPIESVGRRFDPLLHEASERVNTTDSPDNIVLEEVRKGYLLHGKVIRPSVVKVAHNPPVEGGGKTAK